MKLTRYFMMVAAAATMLTACDSAAPDNTLAPQADYLIGQLSGPGNGNGVAPTKDLKRSEKATMLITELGGSLTVGGHKLTVPANAVSQATWFTIHIVEAQKIHVKLRAYRALDGAPVTQFPVVPVRIDFDVSTVDVLDLSYLSVVYLRDGTYEGGKEFFTTRVDSVNRRASADLSHFSDYIIYNGRGDQCGTLENPCQEP